MKDQLTQILTLSDIQESIQQVENRIHSESDGYHPELRVALVQLLSSGGKRIRPTLALLTGKMLGADPGGLITISAAIELLHTATLVHDDLIDGSFLRRGNATLNARWSVGATVLTGDFLFARAAKLAAETNSITAMRLFAEALTVIVNGEITQMFSSRVLASREDYYKRIYSKTASLFEVATTTAASLSPVNDEVVMAMGRFGKKIGMAFQIVDDILDFTGEQATIGKPAGSDLRQGLLTLPAIYYLEAYPDDPDVISFINGNPAEDEGIERLVNSIRESGAIQQAMEEARQYVDFALSILVEQPMSEGRQALEDLSNYIVHRHH